MEYEKLHKDTITRLHQMVNSGKITVETACSICADFVPESEDERIRKDMMETIEKESKDFPSSVIAEKSHTWLAWLEKQGEQNLVNFHEAEKEKNDFVSGNFIQCRKSFNEFKEGESYWFEYIGDDIYIGRSDNILNKKFHITPRQLFKLFSLEHCYKQEEEQISFPQFTFNDVLALQCCMETVKKVQEDKELYEKLNNLHGRVYDAYRLEKQGEQKTVPKFKVGDTMRTLQEATDGYTDGMPVVASIDEEYYHCNNELIAIKDQDDYEYPPMNRRQKPVDNVEPFDKYEGLTDFERTLADICLGWISEEESGWKQYIKDNADVLLKIAVKKFNSVQEQKSAWSEEDEHRVKDTIYFFDTAKKHYASTDEVDACIDWLKSLKERLQPQPKHGWSVEDYNDIETIACHLDNTDNEGMAEVLRNIRDKYYHIIPQTVWKPSDEQMATFWDAICNLSQDSYKWINDMKSLYQDLKKLREE